MAQEVSATSCLPYNSVPIHSVLPYKRGPVVSHSVFEKIVNKSLSLVPDNYEVCNQWYIDRHMLVINDSSWKVLSCQFYCTLRCMHRCYKRIVEHLICFHLICWWISIHYGTEDVSDNLMHLFAYPV